MKNLVMVGFMAMGLNPLMAHAEAVVIAAIESPEFTEVQSETDGAWHVLADLGKPVLPIQASWVEGSRTDLRIRISNEDYVISRADVQVAGEVIVTSACDTVPLAIPNSSTSVSVKGAGESCN